MSRILIRNCRYLVTRPGTMDSIIVDGAIYIEGSLIKAVGKSAEIESQFADQPDVDILDAQEKAVLPGLVDAHNHVGEVHTLLMEGWLDSPITGIVDAAERIYWPAYNWLTEESAYDLTLFGLMHLLKYGATTHSDAMIYPDAIYRASVEAKARTVIFPQVITSVQLSDARDDKEYLAHAEAAIRNYHNTAGGLIQVGVHPNAIFNNSEDMLVRLRDVAREYGVLFATHLAESPEEIARHSRIYDRYGGVVQYLNQLELLGPSTLLFHGTLLNEREIDILAETGTSLVHCPATNAWFGYCAYLPYMLNVGLKIGLGTDCITHNMFNVMLSVMQHHNIMPRELRRVDPAVIFKLASQGGAAVLGLQDQVGSLEPGKKADVITLNLHDNSSLFPLSPQVFYSILSQNGAGTEACDVIIDGKFIRRNSAFTYLDETAIIARAREWCEKFTEDYHQLKPNGQPMFRHIHEEFQPPRRSLHDNDSD